MIKNEKSGKKCIAVHLPVDLLDNINALKEKKGATQGGLIIDLIEKGLGVLSLNNDDLKYFFVKVRIDTSKMMELGQKLNSGELDNSNILMTFCLNDDPSVGLNFWKAKDRKDFDRIFAPHKPYYKEVIDVIQVMTPLDAMKILMAKLK
jgi:hypothetical protein